MEEYEGKDRDKFLKGNVVGKGEEEDGSVARKLGDRSTVILVMV